MKATSLLLLLILSSSLVFAANPARKTIVLRYQPSINPSAVVHGAIGESEVTQCVHDLKSSLKKSGYDIQLGTFPAADGPGRLWINGRPLADWLGDTTATTRCPYCGRALDETPAADHPCRVPVERIQAAVKLATDSPNVSHRVATAPGTTNR